MSSRSPYRSPSPGSDDDPTNDPDMGSQLLEREIRRLEQEIATLKAKLHRAQDTIMELEKVSSSGKPWSSAHLPASSVLIVKAQMCRRRRTATQRLR